MKEPVKVAMRAVTTTLMGGCGGDFGKSLVIVGN